MSEGVSGSGPERLALQGALRHALTSLVNLERLARSLQIGHKQVAALVPEAQTSLEQALGAGEELIDTLPAPLASSPGVVALKDYADAEVTRLLDVLRAAQGAAMNAARRLELERALRDAEPTLIAIARLMAYHELVAAEPRSPAALEPLLRGTLSRSPRASEPPGGLLPLSFEAEEAPELEVKGLSLTEGVALMVSWLEVGADGAHLTLHGSGPDAAVVELTRGRRAGAPLAVASISPIPPLAAVLESAASFQGWQLQLAPAGARLHLR